MPLTIVSVSGRGPLTLCDYDTSVFIKIAILNKKKSDFKIKVYRSKSNDNHVQSLIPVLKPVFRQHNNQCE